MKPIIVRTDGEIAGPDGVGSTTVALMSLLDLNTLVMYVIVEPGAPGVTFAVPKNVLVVESLTVDCTQPVRVGAPDSDAFAAVVNVALMMTVKKPK